MEKKREFSLEKLENMGKLEKLGKMGKIEKNIFFNERKIAYIRSLLLKSESMNPKRIKFG